MLNQQQATYDSANLLDLGAVAVTTSAAGSVAEINLGSASKFIQAQLVMDVSAIKATATDETYVVTVEATDASGFGGTVHTVATLTLTRGVTGRYTLLMNNIHECVLHQYVRMYYTNGGTSPSITCKAWLAPINPVN